MFIFLYAHHKGQPLFNFKYTTPTNEVMLLGVGWNFFHTFYGFYNYSGHTKEKTLQRIEVNH